METDCVDIYANLCAAVVQLEEAKKVIEYYAFGNVKDKHEDENGELVDYEYPAANDPDTAFEYLKKYYTQDKDGDRFANAGKKVGEQ